MKVNITDDPDNWKKWGALVRDWVFKKHPRPSNVGELRAQMVAKLIAGTVAGSDTKSVQFETYSGGGPLKILLPTDTQVLAAEANLKAIAAGSPGLAGPLHYPLPSFYPTVFGPVPEVNLTEPVMLDMGLRRLGEYVIQECQ